MCDLCVYYCRGEGCLCGWGWSQVAGGSGGVGRRGEVDGPDSSEAVSWWQFSQVSILAGYIA